MKVNIPPFLPTALVVCAILWLTLAPHPLPDSDIPLFPGIDKVVHALMFGGLAAVGCFDLWRCQGARLSVYSMILVAGVSALFGGVIEWLQMAMEMGRSAELADFAADVAGAAVCAPLARFLLLKFRKQ